MNYSADVQGTQFSSASGRSPSVVSTRHEDTFAQHFIKTLHRKLHDPSLLQVCPPPPPEFFKHNDKNDALTSTDHTNLLSTSPEPHQVHPDAWGSAKHPFGAPPGSYKILSSDYAWLDAPRQPQRRDGAITGAKPELGVNGEPTPEEVPDPPLYMQRIRFMSHGRLVFVKLRQQLEEICIGAVRRIETAATPPSLATDAATPALSAMPSFAGSTATGPITGGRSMGGSSWAAASFSATSGVGGGAVVGLRGLPPGLVDEIIDSVRTKLGAAFEDCLADTMDQLWGALQYAGSKHALVERMSEAMRQREAELEAAAAKYREEAASRLRSLRRQKEEVEAQAEKDRTELRALASAANQRVDFLEKDLAAARAALDKERTQVAAKLEAQRAASEAALQAKDEAMEALRADSVARLEEVRVLNADVQQQLRQRSEEVAKLSARAADQADLLALALARRDGTFAELEAITGQLEDFKKFVTASIRLPLTHWLRTLKEGDVPLTPLIGGPLTMEYGTGRAFVASARNLNLHAVLEELRRIMPKELPWPEDGWPPDGQSESMCDEETATGGRSSPFSDSPHLTRSPSPAGTPDMMSRNPYAPTLPVTWHRFLRAPLGAIMSPKELMTQLAAIGRAKWEADKAARHRGLPPPDLHAFIYKRFLSIHSTAVDADEEVVNLVQSLRTHSKTLPRAGIWLQLLQLSSPMLPLDACTYYLELFHALVVNPSRTAPNVVDKATGAVWVSPSRWKALLTGEFMRVFDTEGKALLLKQAATVKVDTNRANKTFGMSDVDALMQIVMGVWLSQRQASLSELAMSWTAVEPVGGGVLAVNMDVDQLTKIAAHALGPGVLPPDRTSLLELYFNTVQAARLSQAAARIKWSGLTTAALGTALAAAELLPPRPLTRRGSPAVSRLNVAAELLLRIVNDTVEEMRSHAAFRQNKALEALDASRDRLRSALRACDREEVGAPRCDAEEEEAVAEGWSAAEGVTMALVAAREAFRVFEVNLRESTIRMAVEAALEKQRSASGEGHDSHRLSGSRSRRGSRMRASTGVSGDGMGTAEGTPTHSSGRYSASGVAHVLPPSGRRSAHVSGRPGARPLGSVAARDLRAVLASARWSSSDGDDPLAALMAADGTMASPRQLQRGLSRMRQGPQGHTVPGEQSLTGEEVVEGRPPEARRTDPGIHGRAVGGGGGAAARHGSESAITDVTTVDGGHRCAITTVTTILVATAAGCSGDADDAAAEAGGGPAAVAAAEPSRGGIPTAAVGATAEPGDRASAIAASAGACDSSYSKDQDPDPGGAVEQRMAQLEGKYVRLRSRHDETRRAIQAAYAAAAAAGDAGGPGLPSPEVMAELGPAAKLRLAAELLAEIHSEVERGVWPQLDDTVRAAVGTALPGGGGDDRGGVSRRASRRASRNLSALPPGLRLTVRPSRLPSAPATVMVAAAAAAPSAADVTAAADAAGAAPAAEAASVPAPVPAVAPAAPAAAPAPAPALPGALAQDIAALPAAIPAASSVIGYGALGVQASAVSSVLPAEGAELDDGICDGVGMDVVDEDEEGEGEEGQDGTADAEEPHPAEVAELAGRLHAHAGHVGQVMAAAALETAALATALENLTSWQSSRSRTASIRLHGSGGVVLSRNGSGEALGSGHTSEGSGPTPYGKFQAADDLYGASATKRASSILHRSSALQRLQSAGRVPPLRLEALGGYEDWLVDRPNSAHASGSGGSFYRSEHSAANAANAAAANAGASGASTAGEEGIADPWGVAAHDADPRDTVYLDALRSLHLAAQSQSATEGDVGPLVAAVREVVRLLGGQPKVMGDGRVIEFFPRRVPRDWRAPVLRNSLSRLYIYVCGALMQQQERAALLREASVDLTQRHASLARAAEELSAKVSSLRSLEASLGAQLATLTAFVTHGLVLMDCLGKLDTAHGALQALVASAPATEYAPSQLPPPSPPSPQLGGVQLSRTGSVRVPSSSRPSSSVHGPSLLSRTSLSPTANSARPNAAAVAAPLAPPPPFAHNELAVTAAAVAAAYTATHQPPATGISPEGSTAPSGASSQTSSSPGPLSPVAGVSRGAARLPGRVVLFSVDEWEDVRTVAASLAAAVAQVQSASRQLSAIAQIGGGTPATDGPKAPAQVPPAKIYQPAAARLPNGDHILEVHVHVAGPNLPETTSSASRAPAARRAATAAEAGSRDVERKAVATTAMGMDVGVDMGAAAAAVATPSSGFTAVEGGPLMQLQTLSFVVELPMRMSAAGTQQSGEGASPVPFSTASTAAAAAAVAQAAAVATPSVGGREDFANSSIDSDGEGDGGRHPGPGGDSVPNPSTHGAWKAPIGVGLPEIPAAETPAVSPEASARTLLAPPPGFYLQMALRRAHAAPDSGGSSDGPTDLSVLPPGEALVQLSNSMLRRSAQAAVRKHRVAVAAAAAAAAAAAGSGGGGGHRAVSAAAAAAAAAAAQDPGAPHNESRPLTARAFVECVMAQAREEQLQRLYGSVGSMPRGGLPEVEGLARMDQHEAALLAQHVLQLAGPHPEPVTALEALLQEHKEAEAANAASRNAVIDPMSAAGTPQPHLPQQQQQQPQQQPLSKLFASASAGPAGAALKWRGRGLTTAGSQWARSPPRQPVAPSDQGRMSAGVTGTRLSTPPAIATLGSSSSGNAALGPRSAHLGYYPGLQVNAAGRVMDWRLPLLVPFAPNQQPLQRNSLAERKQQQQQQQS